MATIWKQMIPENVAWFFVQLSNHLQAKKETIISHEPIHQHLDVLQALRYIIQCI